MATTAGGTPYVESSDLVANYPAVSLALAEHIDDLPQTVLQIVRATDTTRRSTTSTSFVDANLSVTITPTATDSAIILISTNEVESGSASVGTRLQLTDNSNNAISSAQQGNVTTGAGNTNLTLIGYATPATTSAVTYKQRFRLVGSGTAEIANDNCTGQLYAIEVSA